MVVVNVEVESSSMATSIVKVACMFIIGICLLNGVENSSQIDTAHTATVTLSENPVDGDTLTLDNNIFEFDSGDGVVTGHIPVTIGTSLDETGVNFVSAVNNVADYEVR